MVQQYCGDCANFGKNGYCPIWEERLAPEEAGCKDFVDRKIIPERLMPTDGLPDYHHRHCQTCRIRTICDWTRVCTSLPLKRFDYHRYEKPIDLELKETVDILPKEIKGFMAKWKECLTKAYKFKAAGNVGDPMIDIKLTILHAEIKIDFALTLPTKEKFPLGKLPIVRENGVFRLEREKQQEMF